MLRLLFTSRQLTYFSHHQWTYVIYGPLTSVRAYKRTPTPEDELDYMEHMLTNENRMETMEQKKDYKRMHERDKAIRKQKTIERKFFRKPQEISLLTYAAKEQIRFLFNEYPDEWTIDRLAASFPISREGVIKLIKSKSVWKSEEQILEHDLRVKNNWKALKAAGNSNVRGPITVKYQELISSGKINLLQYCMGNGTLPKPLASSVAKVTALEARKQRPPGVFESIIYNYCSEKETKRQSDKIQNVIKSQLLENDDELRTLLKSLIPRNLKDQTVGTRSTSGTSASIKQIKAKHESTIDQKSVVSTHKPDKDHSNIVTKSFDNILDESNMENNDKKLMKRSRGRVMLGSHSNTLSIEQMQLQGTGKIGSIKSEEEIQKLQRENQTQLPQKMSKYKTDDLSEHVRNSLQIEESSSGTKTPYIYSDQDGYQYPFGIESGDDEFIEIPADKQNPGKLYKKGDKYYDHTGEFLYRVPEY